MGAVFSTEDSLRRMSKELDVPSVAGHVGDAADGDVNAAVCIKRASRARERDRAPAAGGPAPSSEPRAATMSRLRRLWRRAIGSGRDAIADVADGGEQGEPR